ncbi:hypothetical protein ACFQ2B_33485 [Streptomyces stramineus]
MEAPAARKVPRPRTAKKKTDRGAGGQRAARTAPGREAEPAARAKGGPALGDLVVLALQHHEPRTVAEIVQELTSAHPERTVNPQSVRNALEALAKAGRVDRERKQKSVFYTAPEKGADTSGTEQSAAPGEKSEADA